MYLNTILLECAFREEQLKTELEESEKEIGKLTAKLAWADTSLVETQVDRKTHI